MLKCGLMCKDEEKLQYMHSFNHFVFFYSQDVNEQLSIRFPELYKPGQTDKFFNYFVFGSSLFQGVVTSIVIFFIPYGECLKYCTAKQFLWRLIFMIFESNQVTAN